MSCTTQSPANSPPSEGAGLRRGKAAEPPGPALGPQQHNPSPCPASDPCGEQCPTGQRGGSLSQNSGAFSNKWFPGCGAAPGRASCRSGPGQGRLWPKPSHSERIRASKEDPGSERPENGSPRAAPPQHRSAPSPFSPGLREAAGYKQQFFLQ